MNRLFLHGVAWTASVCASAAMAQFQNGQRPFGNGSQAVMQGITTGRAPAPPATTGGSVRPGGRPGASRPGVGRPGGGTGRPDSHWHGQRRRHWNRSTIVVSAPYWGGYYYGSGYDYGYGNGAYAAAAQNQNARLRDRIQDLEQENAQLRREADRAVDPNAPRHPADPVLKEQQRAARERSKQLQLAGTRLFAAGSYLKAIERWREAARVEPGDAGTRLYLAQAYFATRRYLDAVAEVKSALALNPGWLAADFDPRDLYGKADDWDTQMATLARQLQADPHDRDLLFLLGYELFMTDQREKSAAIFEQADRLDRDAEHLRPFLDQLEKDRVAEAPRADDRPAPAAAPPDAAEPPGEKKAAPEPVRRRPPPPPAPIAP